MGIGSTMKSMLSSDTDNPSSDNAPTFPRKRDSVVEPGTTTSRNAPSKIPMPTPITTTAMEKDPTELAMEHDLNRSRTSGSSAGFGTDAAAAIGGTLAGTHLGHRKTDSGGRTTGRRDTVLEGGPGGGATRVGSASGDVPKSDLNADGRSYGTNATGTNAARTNAASRNANSTKTTGANPFGANAAGANAVGMNSPGTRATGPADRAGDKGDGTHAGVLGGAYNSDHTKHNPRDFMPDGNAQEDTNHLQPVTHEQVRHVETEEVCRVKEHERHIHHIQHHLQPLITREELPEQVHERVHPITHVSEKHVNKVEDNTLFNGQVRQCRDSVKHVPKERIIIDKGVTINEHIHHHIHHVIQPVIQKETIDRHRIHTTIPIHEVTHEAPVVHNSQTHPPVALEYFLQRGGVLHGAISQDDIPKRVLHGGQYSRDVDGIAETLEKDLNLGKSAGHAHPTSNAVDGREKVDLEKPLKFPTANTAPTVDQPTAVPARN